MVDRQYRSGTGHAITGLHSCHCGARDGTGVAGCPTAKKPAACDRTCEVDAHATPSPCDALMNRATSLRSSPGNNDRSRRTEQPRDLSVDWRAWAGNAHFYPARTEGLQAGTARERPGTFAAIALAPGMAPRRWPAIHKRLSIGRRERAPDRNAVFHRSSAAPAAGPCPVRF